MNKPNNHYSVKNNADFGVIIPSFLDDYGLTPTEFRIYAHIARRAGRQGSCWEGMKSIASCCKIGIKIVRKNISTLEKEGLITIEERPGKTSLIWLNDQSKWIGRNTGGSKMGIPKRDLPPLPNGIPHPYPMGSPKESLEGIQLKKSPLYPPKAENPDPEEERGGVKTDPEKAPSEPTEQLTKPTDTSLSLEGKARVSGTVQQPSLKDHYSAPQSVQTTRSRQGKKMLGNQEIVKAEIQAIVADYPRFIQAQIDYLPTTSHYKNSTAKITERTILHRYARNLSAYSEPTERELINLRENIQADIEKHGLTEEIQTELPLAPKIGDNAMLYLYHELYLKQGFEAVKSWILRKANRGEHGTDPSANFKAFEQFRMEQEGC